MDAMSMLDELRKQAGAGDDAALLRTRSAGHVQRGNVAMTHDNLTLALHEYQEALGIDEALADRHPRSAQAQRHLSICLQRLGYVAVQMGQLCEAKVWFERALKISEKLALADANDAQAQRDLIVSHYKRADLYHRLGSPSVARSEAQVAATLLARLRPRLTQSDADSIEQALRALLR